MAVNYTDGDSPAGPLADAAVNALVAPWHVAQDGLPEAEGAVSVNSGAPSRAVGSRPAGGGGLVKSSGPLPAVDPLPAPQAARRTVKSPAGAAARAAGWSDFGILTRMILIRTS